MSLRIRSNAVIRELNIPDDKLVEVRRVYASNLHPQRKKEQMRKITGGSPCCICGEIPNLEMRYEVGDTETPLTRVERYCNSCVKTVYERTESEPKDSIEDTAAYYNCIKVDQLPKTQTSP